MKTITYKSQNFTKDGLFKMRGPDLVALHNELADKAGGKPTKRFPTIGSGVERTWKLLEQVGSATAAKTAEPATKAGGKPATKAEPKALEPTGDKVLPCRIGSQQALMIDLMKQPSGVKLSALAKALAKGSRKGETEPTPGLRARVIGVARSKGYGVLSERADGDTVLKLMVPKGFTIPPHAPLKSAQPAAH